MFTRHHDGYVRQEWAREVVPVAEPWVVPFMVQLLGEYVVEIVVDLHRGLRALDQHNSAIAEIYRPVLLTYLHGVAEGSRVSEDLDTIEVPPGAWAVFRTTGPYPAALQSTWAATAADWFPSNPSRLPPGPSVVAILDRTADFSTATSELWLPVERAQRREA